jgi:hypothetical protein
MSLNINQTSQPSQSTQLNLDEENQELSTQQEPQLSNINTQNHILKYLNQSNYCVSLFDYMRKIFHFSQIDFYSAYIQLLYSFKPNELNEMSKIRKQLKNQWARDDPGFIIVIMFNILITSISYSFTFAENFRWIGTFFIQFFLFFLLFGLGFSYFIMNFYEKYYKIDDSYAKQRKIEIFYAFDIHCNSFVPLYFMTFTIQLLLFPIIDTSTYISSFISNILYAIGICGYVISTNIGYSGKLIL